MEILKIEEQEITNEIEEYQAQLAQLEAEFKKELLVNVIKFVFTGNTQFYSDFKKQKDQINNQIREAKRKLTEKKFRIKQQQNSLESDKLKVGIKKMK